MSFICKFTKKPTHALRILKMYDMIKKTHCEVIKDGYSEDYKRIKRRGRDDAERIF